MGYHKAYLSVSIERCYDEVGEEMERLREIKIKGWVHRAVYLFLGKGKDGIILGEG